MAESRDRPKFGARLVSSICQDRRPKCKISARKEGKLITDRSRLQAKVCLFVTVIAEPEMGDVVDSMLDLMRRLPPTRTEENVSALIKICPDYADDLLGSVDQPLKVKMDPATGREYLACDYNRDSESYRWV